MTDGEREPGDNSAGTTEDYRITDAEAPNGSSIDESEPDEGIVIGAETVDDDDEVLPEGAPSDRPVGLP